MNRLFAMIAALTMLLGPKLADARPPESLDEFARELHRRHGDCETLARLADKALNFYTQRYHRGPAILRDYVERFLGVNLFDSNEMHRVVCRLTEASTLYGLLEALDELGVADHVISMFYNMVAGRIPYVLHTYTEDLANGWVHGDQVAIHEAVLAALQTLNGSHLVGFDPEGTRWIIENYWNWTRLPAVDWPSGNTAEHVDTEALCDELVQELNAILDAAVFEHDSGTDVVGLVDTITGVDLHDGETIRMVVCMVARATNIHELFLAFENAGILNHVLVSWYLNWVDALLWIKDNYEYEGEVHYDSYIYNQIQEQKAEREAVYLPLIDAMLECGLLSLEIDLSRQ